MQFTVQHSEHSLRCWQSNMM